MPGHQSQSRDIVRQLGWTGAKLLSVLISYCRITDYARPWSSSLPGSRGARTVTQYTGRLPDLLGEYVNKQCLPLSAAKYTDEGIYFSHTKGPDVSLL